VILVTVANRALTGRNLWNPGAPGFGCARGDCGENDVADAGGTAVTWGRPLKTVGTEEEGGRPALL
jgi:hypothetical protein